MAPPSRAGSRALDAHIATVGPCTDAVYAAIEAWGTSHVFDGTPAGSTERQRLVQFYFLPNNQGVVEVFYRHNNAGGNLHMDLLYAAAPNAVASTYGLTALWRDLLRAAKCEEI